MKFEIRRILAVMLLFVALTGLVLTFSENVLCAGELPGAHETTISHEQKSQQAQDSMCPCAPSQSNTSDDHSCPGDCGCPCNAPLLSALITLIDSRSFTYLYHAELTRYIPNVYLSFFVPPDSATV